MISELLIKDYKLISFIKSKTPTVFLKVVGVCIIVLFKKNHFFSNVFLPHSNH